MRKTYKFKAKMCEKTESKCQNWLSLCCDLYNASLNQKRESYRKHGTTVSGYTQSKELPDIKSDFPEFKQVNAQTLQQVLERVDKAYKLFFSNLKANNGLAGLPRYKSKSRYDSFTLKQHGWRLDGDKLYIKNIGILKLHLSREIQGDIKQITVKRDSCGDWFVAFSCDNVPSKDYVDFTNDAVGIDVGLSSFLTDSEGVKINNPRWFREVQAKLRKQQRRVSRRKKGSNRRKKAQKQVAKTHRKTARQRRDFHFKLANQYVTRYGAICVEKLQVSNMVKNHKLSKSINDAGWSQFKEILTFKAEEAGRLVIEVDPKFSSQDCSECGNRVKKELWQRVHDCKQCGLKLDRDHNSAIVLKKRGLGQSLQALT